MNPEDFWLVKITQAVIIWVCILSAAAALVAAESLYTWYDKRRHLRDRTNDRPVDGRRRR